ncbi:uncharacterized protein [Temnothorax nylanderi]|uniref:uncharacterized protein n=1 Tax=Temnothorax nylanderi TaxID=102681 RepID=UPI003A8C5BF2
MKDFERAEFLALRRNNGNFEARMSLSNDLQTEFEWWKTNIKKATRSIKQFRAGLEIFSDASRSGWGAYCNGNRTHGHWSQEEQAYHINYLELLSAFFALKCFAENLRGGDVLLRIDNTTAIAYINKMGGIQFPILSRLAKEIWNWCEKRNIWIFASYISSRDNAKADFESRRLEPETEFALSYSAFKSIKNRFGKPEIDLFATRTNTKCERYVSWSRDPGSIAVDAFTIDWSQYFFYAFPPFAIILRVLRKIQDDGARGIVVVPHWPAQAATPDLEEDYPGCRSAICEALKKKNVPEEALTVMLSSLSESSLKQYDSCLKKWWSFCRQNAIEPYRCDASQVIKFLMAEFKRGASYGTLNSCRSAIALLLGPKLGEDPQIRRLFKGITRLRPGRPKYESTWDPQIVLNHLLQWGPNDAITLEKLTYKLVTLLALVTAQRMQTLASIDTRNVRRSTGLIEIKIPDRLKTSKMNKKQPTLIIPFYKENTDVCAASTLEMYLSRTKDLRGTETRLFVALKKPHKSVSSQTLSRWIKKTFKESGVDTDIFDAYSTRHASTSTAKRSGVNIDAIKGAAGWTERSGTFARFYDRNIITDKGTYAKAILDRVND